MIDIPFTLVYYNYKEGKEVKLCRSCGNSKSELEFCKRKASTDGLSAKCKECQSEYDKNRANNPDRVLARKNYSKTKAGLISGNKAKYAYRDRNPNKQKAHGRVAYAIRSGYLTKLPCEKCGEKKVYAHHDDYKKYLDIRWLCSKHHSEWHKKHGEAKNP